MHIHIHNLCEQSSHTKVKFAKHVFDVSYSDYFTDSNPGQIRGLGKKNHVGS